MRLEWLEDILAIAETGSFSGAAERRLLTQSAFSRRIKQIEDAIGVELFDRDHKPIRLKPTTTAQREQILLLSTALRQLVVDLRRGERLTNNRVVIACQHSLTVKRVPKLLQHMPLQRDGIHVKLRSANRDECVAMLLSRQADVAILYRVPNEENDFGSDFLEEIEIGTDCMKPVYNKPLPDLMQTNLRGVNIPFVTYPPDVFLGQVMDRNILPLLHPDLHRMPMVETALTLAAVEMAANGIGVAWVPESLSHERVAIGSLVDLSDVLPSQDLRIVALRVQGAPNTAEGILWSLLQDI
jgi:DNA-binding transcriptional LysR family regulator